MKGKTIILIGLGLVVVILLLKRQTKTAQPSANNAGTQAFLGGLFSLGAAAVNAATNQPQAPSQVNTDVQTTPITDAQEATFTEGHFGADFNQL